MDDGVSPGVLRLARLIAAATEITSAPTPPARTKPYRVREIAALLDVHISTVYKEIGRGSLRAYRAGTGRGAIRITPDALAEYQRDSEARATIEQGAS